MSKKLEGKTVFITGGSRGIGEAIALRFARDGANVAIAAKTDKPHPKLPGTIHTVADAVNKAGGKALPLLCDLRFEEQIAKAVEETVRVFSGIDILINNASAIDLRPIDQIGQKQFALMHEVNGRATYLCSRLLIPHLSKSENAHILTLSPPLTHMSKWLAAHLPYAMSKYSMSMVTLGLAGELKANKVGVNSLWPETLIATAAVANLPGGEDNVKHSRKPEIVADAAYEIVTRSAAECSGNFFIDVEVLRQSGVENFDTYAVDPSCGELRRDIFLD